MRKACNIIIFALLTIVMLCSCFILHIAQQKQQYAQTVQTYIEQFVQQQTSSLQSLSNHILPAVRSRDFHTITKYLSAYEDVLFGIAKQGYTVPGDIHYVSLNAPQVIISSKAMLDNGALVPDQKYYGLLVEDPFKLVISQSFIKPEMPDYPLIHMGIGVIDGMQKFYGALELKLAVKALHAVIAKRVPSNKIFSFEFSGAKLSQPHITISKREFSIACFYYVLWRFLGISAVISLAYLMRSFTAKYRKQHSDLKLLHTELNTTKQRWLLNESVLVVQYKYGALDPADDVAQRVNVSQLLRDVVAVNELVAFERGITLQLELPPSLNILIAYERIALMQILSGILHETLLQLQPRSAIQINVNISNYLHSTQRIEFCFKDNGYYEQLVDRDVNQSYADIRCQGWHKIMALLAEYDVGLEHIHQVYQGNILKLSIVTKLIHNVINFDRNLRELS